MIRWIVVYCLTFSIMFIAGTSVATAADTGEVIVFAAASTTNAVTGVGRLFERREKGKFISSFASSSTLAKQIEHGAPADVYISANVKWMDYLESKNLIEPGTRFDFLSNSIVLIAPKNSAVNHIDIVPGMNLAEFLGDGYFAMGDPDHVPAGIYGKQALTRLGMWSGIENRIARAKDVRAALALVELGESPLGLVYSTDAKISDKVKVVGIFPQDSHPPIIYPVALVSGRKSGTAEKFIKFLKGPESKSIFEKYGFIVH